jgi:hypothetical protein
MIDARFEDGREKPLTLGAQDADELQVLSALIQDAIFPITEMTWQAKQRRFGLLLNRFRWEEGARGQTAPERVQSILVVDNVMSVASQGVDRAETDMILSVLSATFEAGDDGAGDIVFTLAGDGAVRVSVEAIEMTLKDVTRPYVAPSKKAPKHPV